MALPDDVPTCAPALDAKLSTWLEWLETIHPVAIDMGLDRVSAVADRLQLRPVDNPLVLVGGTNGKGSTVAMLSSIYTAAGYRVGAYTSPHIDDFCERIRINGRMAEPDVVVDALAFVESGRSPQTLTYFEYTTLAAMRVFLQSHCDIYLFEVGLGGRLDATNIWDADCSVIASIALDHEDFLGSDISVIATEKAAIGRRGKPLILGELNPPVSLFDFAREHGIIVNHVGALAPENLTDTVMPGEHQRRNAACAMEVVKAMQARVPVNLTDAGQQLMSVEVAGRFEQTEIDGIQVVMDVAHNPAAAEVLATSWKQRFGNDKAQIIFASLANKDIGGIVDALSPVVSVWHCIDLQVPRACAVHDLAGQIRQRGTVNGNVDGKVAAYTNVQTAWQAACDGARSEGSNCILVAGSFHTIACVKAVIDTHENGSSVRSASGSPAV